MPKVHQDTSGGKGGEGPGREWEGIPQGQVEWNKHCVYAHCLSSVTDCNTNAVNRDPVRRC